MVNNNKPILGYDAALRAANDPIVKRMHLELLKLGLVNFDSGYASVMVGDQLKNDFIPIPLSGGDKNEF